MPRFLFLLPLHNRTIPLKTKLSFVCRNECYYDSTVPRKYQTHHSCSSYQKSSYDIVDLICALALVVPKPLCESPCENWRLQTLKILLLTCFFFIKYLEAYLWKLLHRCEKTAMQQFSLCPPCDTMDEPYLLYGAPCRKDWQMCQESWRICRCKSHALLELCRKHDATPAMHDAGPHT